jgi:hypothetical protein
MSHFPILDPISRANIGCGIDNLRLLLNSFSFLLFAILLSYPVLANSLAKNYCLKSSMSQIKFCIVRYYISRCKKNLQGITSDLQHSEQAMSDAAFSGTKKFCKGLPPTLIKFKFLNDPGQIFNCPEANPEQWCSELPHQQFCER